MNDVAASVLLCAMVCATVACSPGMAPATAADAALKSADLASGVVRCKGSGDVRTFLASVKGRDDAEYRTAVDTWTEARNDGAVAGQIAFFSDSQNACESMHGQPGGQFSALNSPLMISAVVQFGDEAEARRAFAGDSVMGISAWDIQQAGVEGMVQGSATGLGGNSVAVTSNGFGLPFFIAMWQFKTLTIFMFSARFAVADMKKAAARQQARLQKLNLVPRPGLPPASPLPTSASGVVGQPVELDAFTVVVTGVDLDAAPGAGDPVAPAGDRYVKATIEVTLKKSVGGRKWTLGSSDGATYEPVTSDESGLSIPPHVGDKIEAVVWFDVPHAATGLKLTVSMGRDRAIVALAPG